MPCTTILVGKKASLNNSTIISRNDDSPSGKFHIKRLAYYKENEYMRVYRSKISKVIIDLPDYNYQFTYVPNVEKGEGIWGANGVNSKNVSMTATETISNNDEILSIDPLIDVSKNVHLSRNNQGIGEEDIVMLVLPYIKSAKDGVLRPASLLEKYGTYEKNGIAFQDENEIWYMETIGGHHFIARRLPDEMVAILPNYFNINSFNLEEALRDGKDNLCSKDLKELIIKNKELLKADNLDFTNINPRKLFGTNREHDRLYNTPRAWVLYEYFTHNYGKYNPESIDIPMFVKPAFKVSISHVKDANSNCFEGTKYDPYNNPKCYRPIGINRTAFIHVTEIKKDSVNELAKAINYIGFASNAFNVIVPHFPRATKLPHYLTYTTLKPSLDSFYWTSRIMAVLSDNIKDIAQPLIKDVQTKIYKYADNAIKAARLDKNLSIDYLNVLNLRLEDNYKQLIEDLFNKLLRESSLNMTNSYQASDNGIQKHA